MAKLQIYCSSKPKKSKNFPTFPNSSVSPGASSSDYSVLLFGLARQKASRVTLRAKAKPGMLYESREEKEKNKVVSFYNLSNDSSVCDVESKNLNGIYYDYETKKEVTFNDKEKISLSPWEFKIYINL